jgi:purine-binding chemotaxis protein CheW
MRNVLRDRARALAAGSGGTGEPANLLEVLRFRLASETYALELAWIAHVRPVVDITPLPGVPPFIRGVVNVGGRIVSLVDLKVKFELPDAGLTAASMVIILSSPAMEIGLLADEIFGIEKIPAESLQAQLPSLSGVRAEYLKGVAPGGLVVLDGARILSADSMVVNDKGTMA